MEKKLSQEKKQRSAISVAKKKTTLRLVREKEFKRERKRRLHKISPRRKKNGKFLAFEGTNSDLKKGTKPMFTEKDVHPVGRGKQRNAYLT